MVARKPDDAIALLKADHRKVEDLFAKAQKARDSSRKQALVTQICTELTVHTMLEEEIFYPASTGQAEDDVIDEAYVEHDGAKVLISELLNSDPSNEFYDAKIKVLSEDIKHHVKEEEKRGRPVRPGPRRWSRPPGPRRAHHGAQKGTPGAVRRRQAAPSGNPLFHRPQDDPGQTGRWRYAGKQIGA